MRRKLDNYLALLFKPLFFAWLAALILFVLSRNYSEFIRWTFAALSVAYGLVIVYAACSLVMAVREALKEDDNF